MKRLFLLLIAAVAILSSCQKKQNEIIIEGTLSNTTDEMVRLALIDIDDAYLLDSVKIQDGHFKFVVAEGVNEEGPIFTFGDTNMRTRFTCGAREFCNKWSEAGPTHHMAAAVGRHIDTILKVAKIFNVPVDIVTR